jgi:hypothetical protein
MRQCLDEEAAIGKGVAETVFELGEIRHGRHGSSYIAALYHYLRACTRGLTASGHERSRRRGASVRLP